MKDGWYESGTFIWYYFQNGEHVLILLNQPHSVTHKFMWRAIGHHRWWSLPFSIASIEEAQAVAVANWRMQ